MTAEEVYKSNQEFKKFSFETFERNLKKMKCHLEIAKQVSYFDFVYY
jgi:hypothetical protein